MPLSFRQDRKEIATTETIYQQLSWTIAATLIKSEVQLRYIVIFLSVICTFNPLPLQAELASLLGGDALHGTRSSIIQKPTTATAPDATIHKGSLFAGKGGLGLFAPHPARTRRTPQRMEQFTPAAMPQPNSPAGHIRNIISKAEAGRQGYDAVQHGARIRPTKPPTQMTIAEVYQWIDATPGQPHAIGRYQFIPPTLRRLVQKLGLSPNEQFNSLTQDRLADVLLAEAGFAAATRGELSRTAFMNNLAKIWAGLPNSTGRSHYHGHAGNRATMTWTQFNTEMAKVFPS